MSVRVRLIEPDEKFVFVFGETEFFYKRPTAQARRNCAKRHTKNGKIDPAFADSLLKQYVTGWEKMGDDIPFDKELVPHLPEDIKNRLHTLMQSATGGITVGQYEQMKIDAEKEIAEQIATAEDDAAEELEGND